MKSFLCFLYKIIDLKNLFNMERKNYESLVINYDKNLIKCNEKECIPLTEDIFTNATITFNDNHSVTVEGEVIQFGFEFHDISPDELDYEVEPSYIKKTLILHRPIIRAGWHRKVNTEHKKVTLSHYTIVE